MPLKIITALGFTALMAAFTIVVAIIVGTTDTYSLVGIGATWAVVGLVAGLLYVTRNE